MHEKNYSPNVFLNKKKYLVLIAIANDFDDSKILIILSIVKLFSEKIIFDLIKYINPSTTTKERICIFNFRCTT